VVNLGAFLLANNEFLRLIIFVDDFCSKLRIYIVDQMGEGTCHVYKQKNHKKEIY
jgi:hypothetical protein